MDGIIYLTLEQAEVIHRKTITYSGGGTYEPLDTGKLDSVLQHIQNDLYYPDFVDKLTHLFYCTCEFHCFADGNKRLAITLSLQFLLWIFRCSTKLYVNYRKYQLSSRCRKN